MSGRFLRAVAAAENVLMGSLLVSIVLVILAQVVFRYVLARPLSWSIEVATGLLVYIAFLGLAIGVRDHAHVSLNLFERRLGPRGLRVVRIVEQLALAVVLAAIGIGAVTYLREQSDVTTPAGLRLWWILLAMPIGCALGCLHAVVGIVDILRGTDRAGAEPEREAAAEVARIGGGV
jgi:TRAP-type C4-dicarboxylate transport system permease small subunit